MKLGQYLISFSITEEIQKLESLSASQFHYTEAKDHTPLASPSQPELSNQPALEGSSLIDMIYKAAGLQVCHPDNPQMAMMTAERIGILLKAYTQGLKKALDARGVVKDELRASRTLLGARDNNPLKFIQHDADSLQEMLFGSESSYKDAESAIGEAFNDLIAHEMAIFAAFQISATSIINRFNPNEIEASVSGGIGFQKKM